MNISRQEEIIAALWAIAALIAFNNEFVVWGWIFTIKAIIDTACSFFCAIKEIRKKDNAENER